MGEYASITGLIISLIVLYFGLRHEPKNVLFAFFHFMFSLVFYIEFQFLLGKHPASVAVAASFYPWAQFLVGPAAYFYILAFIGGRKQRKIIDTLHILPAILLLAGTFPYFLTSWTDKLETAEVIIRDGNIVRLNAWFTNTQGLWLKIIHNISYLSICIILLIRYFRKLRKEGRLDFSDVTQRWILFYAGSGTLLALLNTSLLIIRMSFSSRQAFQLNSFILLSVPLIVFFSFNFLLLFFPHILYGILKLKTPDMLAEEMFPNTSTTDKKTKSSAELKIFTSEYVQEIENKLTEYISLKKYCETDCSIGQLTSFSGIPAHHLSHYFNQILKEKFSDWRSRLRINHSITLMHEGSARDLKLDEIARQCGYNVRSTFIDAFRKETGTTPGDYLRKLSSED